MTPIDTSLPGHLALGLTAAFLSSVLLTSSACQSTSSSTLEKGGVYSIEIGPNTYSAVKLLALPEDLPDSLREENVVLVRWYLSTYDHRPTEEELTSQSSPFGSMEEQVMQAFALPIRMKDVTSSSPELIVQQGISDIERNSVKLWKEMGANLGGLETPW